MFDRIVHHHHHYHSNISEARIMAKLDQLEAAIKAEDATIASFLNSVPQRITDAVAAARDGDDARVDAIIADVTAQTNSIAAASGNTTAVITPESNNTPATPSDNTPSSNTPATP